jgi:CubicO group peptidase (beta-lactamase class C family)
LGERLLDIYPELFDDDIRKQMLTIEDALTMQTGLEFDNDKHTLQLYQTNENSARFVLSLPFVNEPGTVMNYNDGAPHLVSKMIEVKTGKTLSEFAGEKLFAPLDITDWKWEHAHDGTTFGAFSLFLKPRDFAKVGQLLLQQGNWNGDQIISQEYLSNATSHHVTNDQDMPYGYYFWIDENHGGYYAHGHGGQVLLIVPTLNLVLLYTAWPYTSREFFDDAFDLFDLIIQGCE